MTNKQLHLLKTLQNQTSERVAYVKWTIEGLNDSDVIELQDRGLIFVRNDDFEHNLRLLYLTQKGHAFIKDFCDVCECMPCDCDWGH